MDVIGKICKCGCHKNGYLHCFPCCFQCPHCNENISYNSCGTLGINDFEKVHMEACSLNRKDSENNDTRKTE